MKYSVAKNNWIQGAIYSPLYAVEMLISRILMILQKGRYIAFVGLYIVLWTLDAQFFHAASQGRGW